MSYDQAEVVYNQRTFMSRGNVTDCAGRVGIVVMQAEMMHNQKLGAQPDTNYENRMTGTLTHIQRIS